MHKNIEIQQATEWNKYGWMKFHDFKGLHYVHDLDGLDYLNKKSKNQNATGIKS